MTEGLNFSRIYSAAFLTHQEDRNVLTDKKFIAKIQVCLPTNYRPSHHHTVRKKIFFVFLLRNGLLSKQKLSTPKIKRIIPLSLSGTITFGFRQEDYLNR